MTCHGEAGLYFLDSINDMGPVRDMSGGIAIILTCDMVFFFNSTGGMIMISNKNVRYVYSQPLLLRIWLVAHYLSEVVNFPKL